MNIYSNPPREKWDTLTSRPSLDLDFLESTVKNILTRVKNSGDAALKELTLQFDKIELTSIQVTEEEFANAEKSISPSLVQAIRVAQQNIEKFHRTQISTEVEVETMKGVTCWRRSVPIRKIGIYIPGGTAPLFSTVLMLGIPAKIAGCSEIALCTPPDANGAIHPAILVAAKSIGISKIFKIGGAQAIAALAYGTESIPKVSKIFGPGNQYVTMAKQVVSQQGTAIDMPAGPSEVLILADESANSAFLAADLLSQAEHGEDSQVVLVLTNPINQSAIEEELTAQLAVLPRKLIAENALRNSRILLFDKLSDAIDFVNDYAPEHLIINMKNESIISEQIENAGSVFLGNYTPEAAGDYASGTNHTLPTNGYAKAYSGVSVDSFVKKITYQRISKEGITNIGPTIEILAEAEQLVAHKNAISIRLSSLIYNKS
jgi:histidinol dehydrogenase